MKKMTIGDIKKILHQTSDDIECVLFSEGNIYPLLEAKMDIDGKYFEFCGGWLVLKEEDDISE